MKKSALVVAALAFGATTAFAQLESKKGEPYLPEAGDWAIGVDATPFLHYFGNMLNGNTNNGAPNWGWSNGTQQISGKMFSSETMAYRGSVRIGFGSNKWTNMVNDDNNTSATPAYVEDSKKTSWNAIGLSAGIEMRRGKTRLQGYYGAEFMFWMSGMKDTYTYGNDYTTSNPAPTTTDFTTQISQGVFASSGAASRLKEMKYGSELGFGVRGFIGAEYFVLPKISVGGEFGWGIGFSSTGAGTATTEAQGASGSGEETSFTTGKSSSFAIDTDANAFGIGASGALLVHFHF